MGTTPAAFTGTSTYAADLQQAINHAVTIASAPLTQLNASVTALQGQGNELATLQTGFAALQTAIQNLAKTTQGGDLAASVSDNTIATATLNSANAISSGSYLLKVISAGSPTTTVSLSTLPTVADPTSSSFSSSSSFTLTVGTSTFTIKPGANTLNALTQAINSSGAGVNATLINLGSPSAPDYRLSLQSTGLGNIAIQLNDGTHNLLSTSTTGTSAQYQVNGQPSTPISSNSDTVTLAPGLTVDLVAPGQTTITVASNSSGASNALSAFVSAYNATIDELSKNHGTGGGALTGQTIILSLEQSLRNLSGFAGGSGAVQSLTDLGITFDQTGHLSFDQTQFSSVESAHPSDVAAFLGAAPGSGFLNAATNILTGLNNPTTGLFLESENVLGQQINFENRQISDTQNKVADLQNRMVAQMSSADALIASLQSQATYFTNLFADTQAVQNAITFG